MRSLMFGDGERALEYLDQWAPGTVDVQYEYWPADLLRAYVLHNSGRATEASDFAAKAMPIIEAAQRLEPNEADIEAGQGAGDGVDGPVRTRRWSLPRAYANCIPGRWTTGVAAPICLASRKRWRLPGRMIGHLSGWTITSRGLARMYRLSRLAKYPLSRSWLTRRGLRRSSKNTAWCQRTKVRNHRRLQCLPYVGSLTYLTVFGSIVAFGATLVLAGNVFVLKTRRPEVRPDSRKPCQAYATEIE